MNGRVSQGMLTKIGPAEINSNEHINQFHGWAQNRHQRP